MDTNTTPSWLVDLGAVTGLALNVIREVRAPSPTPIPSGSTGIQVSRSAGGISLTTSPVVVVAAIGGLALVVWLVTR